MKVRTANCAGARSATVAALAQAAGGMRIACGTCSRCATGTGLYREVVQALIELRRSLPDVIISDLRMPNMSGFELLSVVRRRFPHIPVIAISGEFNGESPAGVIADAFFTKGQYSPEEMFKKIAELIERSPLRPNVAKPDRAPVWIPRTDAGYCVITCTDCLRSFSVPNESSDIDSEVRSTACIFCGTTVRYLADFRTVRKKTSKRPPESRIE